MSNATIDVKLDSLILDANCKVAYLSSLSDKALMKKIRSAEDAADTEFDSIDELNNYVHFFYRFFRDSEVAELVLYNLATVAFIKYKRLIKARKYEEAEALSVKNFTKVLKKRATMRSHEKKTVTYIVRGIVKYSVPSYVVNTIPDPSDEFQILKDFLIVHDHDDFKRREGEAESTILVVRRIKLRISKPAVIRFAFNVAAHTSNEDVTYPDPVPINYSEGIVMHMDNRLVHNISMDVPPDEIIDARIKIVEDLSESSYGLDHVYQIVT